MQTFRIEGFSLWPIKIEGLKAANARLEAALEAQEREYKAAQAEAAERAQQAREAAQERYADIARNADNELEQARRTLEALPKFIEDFAKSNPRSRVGLYLLCLDGQLRDTLFTDGKPRQDADIPAFLTAARLIIEKDPLLTSEEPKPELMKKFKLSVLRFTSKSNSRESLIESTNILVCLTSRCNTFFGPSRM